MKKKNGFHSARSEHVYANTYHHHTWLAPIGHRQRGEIKNILCIRGPRHGFAVRYAFQPSCCARLKRSEENFAEWVRVHTCHQSSVEYNPLNKVNDGEKVENLCTTPCLQSSGLEIASPNSSPGELHFLWCSGYSFSRCTSHSSLKYFFI